MSLTLSGPNPIGIAPGEKYGGFRHAYPDLPLADERLVCW